MANHIIAPVHDHRNQELRHIIKKQCEYTSSSSNACHSSVHQNCSVRPH